MTRAIVVLLFYLSVIEDHVWISRIWGALICNHGMRSDSPLGSVRFSDLKTTIFGSKVSVVIFQNSQSFK